MTSMEEGIPISTSASRMDASSSAHRAHFSSTGSHRRLVASSSSSSGSLRELSEKAGIHEQVARPEDALVVASKEMPRYLADVARSQPLHVRLLAVALVFYSIFFFSSVSAARAPAPHAKVIPRFETTVLQTFFAITDQSFFSAGKCCCRIPSCDQPSDDHPLLSTHLTRTNR